MKKLFLIGIGGGISKANIEVHDVQFVIADSIEDTYEVLKSNWYGDSLHLDEYKELKGADGYRLEISESKQESKINLYFVNMGGYVKEKFGELHEFGLYAAETEREAKTRSKKDLLINSDDHHVDYIHNLESCLKASDGKKYYINLIFDDKDYNLKPDWNGYLLLGE